MQDQLPSAREARDYRKSSQRHGKLTSLANQEEAHKYGRSSPQTEDAYISQVMRRRRPELSQNAGIWTSCSTANLNPTLAHDPRQVFVVGPRGVAPRHSFWERTWRVSRTSLSRIRMKTVAGGSVAGRSAVRRRVARLDPRGAVLACSLACLLACYAAGLLARAPRSRL